MFLSDNIIYPIRLLFRKDRESYFVLKRILGFYPHHISFYNQALMHKSVHLRTENGQRINNERLEFLGDAILGAVVGDVVYRHFKGKREGFLTNTRSKIVQRETLNRVAVKIGLDKLIKCSSPTHSHNSYMCGNAFEAFIGAIYLDRGYRYCYKFIEDRILHQLIDIDKVANEEINFKSKLIEWCQKKRVQVKFELISQHRIRKEAYSPVFESRVLLEGIVCGEGNGYSKKESQQRCAQKAMKNIRNDKELMKLVFEAKEAREKLEENPSEMAEENVPTAPLSQEQIPQETEVTVEVSQLEDTTTEAEKEAVSISEEETTSALNNETENV